MSSHMMGPQQIVEKALGLSTADGCQVIVSEDSDANLRWAGNTLTTNGVSRSRGVTVISTVGGAVGVVSRSNPDTEALAEMVRAAEDAARRNDPAEDAGPLVTPEQAPSVPGWDNAPVETSIGVFSHLATGLGAAFERARSADQLLFGFASHNLSTTYLGTSAGIRLRHVQPTGKVEINAKSADYARSAWAGTATRDFTDVDVAALDAELTVRLGWAEKAIALDAGSYETILPPSAVSDLMIYAYWTGAGRDAAEGRTVFSAPGGGTRVGERLTDAKLTLRSDPGAPGLECCPFAVAGSSSSMSSVFDNGLAMGATDWIRNGELTNLINTRFTAAKTGGAVAPPIDNLILGAESPGPSLTEMIAGTSRALLLTCLWYVREVDAQTLLLTGLTRDGVYLVEHGEVVGAVNNFRFNVSPVDLLGRMTEIGPTQPCLPREWSDYFTRAAMPPVRVDGFLMSSVSQAS
ncbi:metallopeptidase TldD-related protein [Sporichthya sp.]|uniref:metallopeptidase TldD-related protein n=1 Tax=Sporichthya sp. TaxID=65475 RepID=UPI0018337B95|nr:metallopeptidase TldD-related protein [Sporichthya sp.]MBA3741571.1 TldD/PmbA family protein [Sporichthya sp.]